MKGPGCGKFRFPNRLLISWNYYKYNSDKDNCYPAMIFFMIKLSVSLKRDLGPIGKGAHFF